MATILGSTDEEHLLFNSTGLGRLEGWERRVFSREKKQSEPKPVDAGEEIALKCMLKTLIFKMYACMCF